MEKQTITMHLIILLTFTVQIFAQDPILSEIMFNPDGSDSEFIELYNPTNQNIDLSNYQILYATSSADFLQSYDGGLTILSPQSFAVIVEGDFDINSSPYSFPSSALIVELDDNAFGSSGMANGSDRDIFLLNAADDTISVYTYSANNSNGFSDEKIILNTDNSSDNWANSLTFNGTPGSKNSVSPKENDLSIDEITITPNPQIADEPLDALVKTLNLGTNNAATFDVSLFNDENFNSTAEESELIDSFTLNNLASGDSVTQNFNLGTFVEGNYQLIAIVDLPDDEASFNDTLLNSFTVLPPPPPSNAMVINEIMYDPPSGEPEWVEIYNRSDQTYNLAGWQIADAVGSSVITNDDIMIAPDEHVVLTDDALISDFYDIDAEIIVMNLPAFNNGGDDIVLIESNSFVIDSLTYSSSWGGSDDTSLERIDPDSPSDNSENWGSSVSPDAATPGKINSLSPKIFDLIASEITLSPTPPVEGDNLIASVLVKNIGENLANTFTVELYNDENFDSTPQSGELIDSINLSNLASGDSVSQDFNLGSFSAGNIQLIAVVELTQDEDITNNQLVEEFIINDPPPQFNAIVVNEIMYAPSTGEPEWVEIYNQSDETFSLQNWQFADATNTVLVTTESISISPGEYIVLAANSSVSDFYDIDSEIIVMNLPALNNGGDKVTLMDGNSFIIDSLAYTSSWGGSSGGRTLERILFEEPSHEPSNWETSVSPDKATPGDINSLTPKDYDLTISEINISPTPPIEDTDLTVDVVVQNIGNNQANSFTLQLYNDDNFDSNPQSSELINLYNLNNLNSGQSLSQNFSLGSFSAGSVQLIARIVFSQDEDNTNNQLIREFTINETPPPYNSIVVNEVMYAPTNEEPEWIEIYNRSDRTYNLANWEISDAANTVLVTTESINISPGEYIVLASGGSISNYYDIDSRIIVTNLPALNNTGDDIVLRTNNSIIIESFSYSSSWGGNNGRSLERIDVDSQSDNPTNWGTSIHPNNATPGKVNSLTPKDYDLTISEINISPNPPIENSNLTATVITNNTGNNQADLFTVELYNDENFDSTPQVGELIDSFSLSNLASGDSVLQDFNLGSFAAGNLQLIAVIEFNQDEDITNNQLVEEFTINEPPPPFNAIVINEIMYAPSSVEPEWVEIYNQSEETYNLQNWQFADAANTVLITTESISVSPGEYIILAANSSVSDFYNIDSEIIVLNLPSLNNDGDEITLMDDNSFIIDSLTYTSSWVGNSGGRSLERILFEQPSHEPSNWGTSVSPDKATPGKINSISPKDFDLQLSEINITPAPPVENTDLTAEVLVHNLGSNQANSFTVELYNDENFDSTPQVGELIDSFNLSNLATGDSVLQNFNLGSFTAGNLQLIAVVEFNQDKDITNNQLIEEFSINEPPPPFNAIVINEIMYAPSSGEPEWVEIYNRSNQTYNLNGWQFADASNTALITTESITISPGEYLVLADDASVSDFYDFDATVIVFDLPALNNTGDRAGLLDKNSFEIDSLTFSSSWGGTSGRSLERILFDDPSNEAGNWGTSFSPNNATPGKVNSLAPKDFDLQLSEISITPAPPVENTDLTAEVLIHNLGSNQANSFTVELYNDENFDSTPQPGELINSFNLSNLTRGDSVLQDFSLGSFSAENVQLIGRVIFNQDVDNTNNDLIYEFTVFPPPPDFNDIVVNEIMYASSEAEPEWVEIYNRSNQAYDLMNWQFADAANTALVTTGSVIFEPGEFVVLAKDGSVESFYDFDATVIVFNLPALNNTGDQVILMDGNSFIIDSLTYLSSWGGTSGRSLERINVDSPSSDAANWGTSVSPNNATPGKVNSLTPKNYDLTISGIDLSPTPPIQDTDLTATVTTANIGNNQANSFTVELYNDGNLDSTPQPGELIGSFESTNLASGDSVSQKFELGSFSAGNLQLIVVVEFVLDEDNTNNQLISEFIINEPPPPFNSIVINEIMYAPSTGEPEWVEIYNRSDQTYDLANWQFADAANISLITTESISISPGEYLVLARDESVKDFYDFNEALIVFNLPALNNGGDRAVLLDPNLFEIDSLTYTSSWGGTGGRSLERINFESPSFDPDNWGTSVSQNKATPGQINSLAVKDFDLILSDITITPSPAIENQELSALVEVTNIGLNIADSYTVTLYNDLNFNSTPDIGELVDSFTRTNLASGDSVNITFELGSFPVGNIQLIGFVQFENDEDITNNELITEFSVFPPPPDYNDIVINEIMYAPQDKEPGPSGRIKKSSRVIDIISAVEPEWIEIYNRSESTYLLSDWRVADDAGSVLITALPITIEPNEYLILAKDSSIFNFYSIDSKVIVIDLPVLNNNGDEIKIMNNNSFLVDSLKYSNTWGGANGNSLERINPNNQSTDQSNWGESISVAGATPGSENSIVPREFDLAVTYFDSQADFLFVNEESNFEVRILNLGTNSMTNATLQIYLDQNDDLQFTENELIEEVTNLDFDANELVRQKINRTFTATGKVNLLATIQHSEDSFSQNDSLRLAKEIIEPNINRGDIVVNEFMYAPNSPYPEWIELYNNSDSPHQLRNFKIADATSSVDISTQNVLMPANSFIVIARDSIITQLYDIPSQVLIRPLPALNNSGDKIVLYDNFERVVDSLEYTSDWGGGEGNSLERINSFGNSSDSSNWTTSTDPNNGTPGKPNSILPKDYDVALTEFFSEPTQPVGGDEVSFHATAENKGTNITSFTIKLFESNSDGNKINQLDEVGVENLAPGAEQTINFNYKIDSFEGDQFFVAEADFELDQDTSDNSQLLLIAPATPPKALVINEIMFVPTDDEPEWIELYNRSEVTINLKDWVVSDVLSRPATAVISFENLYVEPEEFIVLAKDSNIFEYHPGLPSEKVVLVPFANLNNTTDGVVVFDRLGSTIDSVFYSNEFERKSGYSIERLSTEGNSNDPNNWAVSNSPRKGTPGFINSKVPKNYDLEVTALLIDPEFPELGQNIKVAAEVKNIGLQSASNFTLSLSSEKLSFNQEFLVERLDTNESQIIFSDETFKMPESFSLTAAVTFAPDENLFNNNLTESFYSGYPPLSMLVNEVMYSPSAGGSEWIEFVNNSNESINVNQWKVAERSRLGNPVAITDSDIIIEPNEYFVVATDTSTGEFRNLEIKLFEVNFGTLNSTEDDVVIFDFRNAIIDSLNYSSSWGGGGGVSIERISLSAPTNERTNWLPSMSINGSSLGSANSTSGIIQAEKNQVVVNEIMYEPETDNSEFVEFYNTSDQFIEIANWTVEDDSKNSSTISRTSITIPPESYFVVAADSSILLNYPELKDIERLIIVNRNMSLNNSEDLVYLTNAFGATVDSVFYSSSWHNKRTTSTRNKSLERINPFLDGNDPNNWSTSVSPKGSTPGKANSIFIENQESGNAISITPNPFSPDGDGFEDFAIINYKLPREAVSIHIQVFDSKGRKVRSISEDNLFAEKGSIIFDGFNDSGQPLKIGIYILLIETFDSGGSTHTFKEVVVVARKL